MAAQDTHDRSLCSPDHHDGRLSLPRRENAATQGRITAEQTSALLNLIISSCHELNQPLNVLKTAAESLILLVNDGVRGESVLLRKRIDQILRQVERMASVLGSLKYLALHDSFTRLEPIDVNDVVTSAIELEEHFLEQQHPTVSSKLDPGGGAVPHSSSCTRNCDAESDKKCG